MATTADVRPIPALQELLPDELAARLGIELVDARRIVSAIHNRGGLPDTCPARLRRSALDLARLHGRVPGIELVDRAASTVDPFVKYAFRLDDGAAIETVRIPLEKAGRFSVCVSSQVGCALGCAFCATGQMGLVRNLEAWEIVEQVRRVRAELPEGARVHGVVFQGMGEPLANLDRVARAVRILTEPAAQSIDRRNITVCTAGLPAGIRRVAREMRGVRLGISIADARPSRRKSLMPIDATHALDEVLEAAGEYTQITGYAPMFAYTLMAGVNDDDLAALALAGRIKQFTERFGVRPRLSLVPMNPVDGAPFERPSLTEIERFRAALLARGVGSILRYSGGGDVGAACGQLVRPERVLHAS